MLSLRGSSHSKAKERQMKPEKETTLDKPIKLRYLGKKRLHRHIVVHTSKNICSYKPNECFSLRSPDNIKVHVDCDQEYTGHGKCKPNDVSICNVI